MVDVVTAWALWQDAKHKNFEGEDALLMFARQMYGRTAQQTGMVAALVDAGADINLRGHKGFTALYYLIDHAQVRGAPAPHAHGRARERERARVAGRGVGVSRMWLRQDAAMQLLIEKGADVKDVARESGGEGEDGLEVELKVGAFEQSIRSGCRPCATWCGDPPRPPRPPPPRAGLEVRARGARAEPPSEKDAELAQKLGQLQPFIAVFPQECMGQLASFGPT